jgi:hypothetical protein
MMAASHALRVLGNDPMLPPQESPRLLFSPALRLGHPRHALPPVMGPTSVAMPAASPSPKPAGMWSIKTEIPAAESQGPAASPAATARANGSAGAGAGSGSPTTSSMELETPSQLPPQPLPAPVAVSREVAAATAAALFEAARPRRAARVKAELSFASGKDESVDEGDVARRGEADAAAGPAEDDESDAFEPRRGQKRRRPKRARLSGREGRSAQDAHALRRQKHNEIELRRRERMKVHYEELRLLCADLEEEDGSEARKKSQEKDTILVRAIAQIKAYRDEITRLRSALRRTREGTSSSSSAPAPAAAS